MMQQRARHGGDTRTRQSSRLLGAGLLTAALLGVSGCLSFVNPVDPPPPPVADACRTVPKCARDHVHIFFINGLDPVDLGNLSGLRNYVQTLGFTRTYYYQCFHGPWIRKEMCRVRAEDPDARFAVVGFSLGHNVGRGLADTAQADGIRLDLLVCVSSNNLVDFSHERPENVDRYIDIMVHGRDLSATDDPATERHNLKGFIWHFGGPSHPETLETLSRELTVLAGTVPVVELPPPAPPFQPEGLPEPRTLPQRAAAPGDGWDVLTPVSHLREPPTLADPVQAKTALPPSPGR
jgi:hypothetical protein